MRPHLLIDYFTDSIPRSGKTLKPHQIIALTYQNLAAEAFADDDLDPFPLIDLGDEAMQRGQAESTH